MSAVFGGVSPSNVSHVMNLLLLLALNGKLVRSSSIAKKKKRKKHTHPNPELWSSGGKQQSGHQAPSSSLD